ncbi:MAG: hypothetical protein MJ214_05030 [Bacilli bacterium]|nr:hypothetical protein [Bacilli bacterium]
MINEIKEAVWSPSYITYFVVTILATIVGLFIINRFVKKEKTLNLILKITAACLLVAVIINRVMICRYYINVLQDSRYNWSYLIFNTFCGLSSFVMALLVLFAKPNNPLFHFFLYVSTGGPIMTASYPEFLASQGFAEPASYTGLIHHTIALFLSLTLVMKRRFNPQMQKLYIYPLGYISCIVLGLFEIQVLKFPDAMNIEGSLVDSLPIFTSWWMLAISTTILVAICITLYLHFREHKSFKKIFIEFKSQFIE